MQSRGVMAVVHHDSHHTRARVGGVHVVIGAIAFSVTSEGRGSGVVAFSGVIHRADLLEPASSVPLRLRCVGVMAVVTSVME